MILTNLVKLQEIFHLTMWDWNTLTWRNRFVKLPVRADVSLSFITGKRNTSRPLWPAWQSKAAVAVSASEMMRTGIRVTSSLVAKSQQQVLRSVSALVLKRCNSTVAVTQARPEDWDYAKPFEDIPGPKPLPIIGNAWRFIPYLGNVPYWLLLL